MNEGAIADTKKVYLDEFVRDFKTKPETALETLVREDRRILRAMESVFEDKDNLLRSQGIVVIYFLLFKDAPGQRWLTKLKRSRFEEFEKARAANREKAEKNVTKADYDLLEFDRYAQTPNDAYAIRLRLATLKNFLRVPVKEE